MLRIARTPWLLSSLLFAFGVTLLALGVSHGVIAEDDGLTIQYNDVRFAEASNAILSYLEGSFGALVMVVAGLVAIISAAFGQYRAAMGCLIIAVGAFILRSFISTFFNDGNIMP
jgi:NhaP-type Na+/H+ and K+/H+ antiporter